MSSLRPLSLLLVSFVVASMAGCDRTGGAEPGSVAQVDTLANGAVHVTNPEGAGLWAESEEWRLVEDLRIGSMDGSGPTVFGRLLSLSFAVDDDGRMFVLDGQANEIRVFDPSGSHLRSFGRAGAGPGELGGGASLAGWGPDGNLWVTDPDNARYSVLSPAGEVLATHRREIRFSMSPWPGAIDVEGRILDIGIRQATSSDKALVRVDPRTLAKDTFGLPRHDGGSFSLLTPNGLPMRSVTIPFAGQLVWQPDPHGYVWSAITDEYRIVTQNLAGDTVRITERALRPIPVTAAERAEALDGLKGFIRDGGEVDASRIPSTKPVINDFMIDDLGYLWVWLQQEESEAATYDVFDPDGLFLGSIASPTPVMTRPRPVFHGDHVYGFTVDELDVPYLVRLRIEGRERSGR